MPCIVADIFFCNFAGCSALASIECSSWDTSSVTGMAGMFFCCLLLSAADVSSWDVSRVTSCDRMFAGCRVLKPTGSFWFHLGNDCVNGNSRSSPRERPFVLPMKLGLPCTTRLRGINSRLLQGPPKASCAPFGSLFSFSAKSPRVISTMLAPHLSCHVKPEI